MNDPVHLFAVRLYYEVVVAACDHTEAEGIALRVVEKEGLGYDPGLDAEGRKIERADQLPAGWELHKPLGSYVKDSTCAEFLES